MSALKPFKDVLTDRSMSNRFTSRRSDPDLKWAAERQHALQIISDNEFLLKCSPRSVAVALMTVASMGLSLAPERKHAYLIPRKDSNKRWVCHATPSYMGLEYLARSTNEISNIIANLVRENDPVFEQEVDQNGPAITHKSARTDPGEVTHAYCVTWYANGHRAVEVMIRAELDQVRSAAVQAQRGTVPFSWNLWESEMQKKAVIRRASKHWPISSARFSRAISAMDEAEPVDVSQPSGLLMSDKQAEGIKSLASDLGMDAEAEVRNICSAYGVDSLTDILSSNVATIRRGLKNRAKVTA